MNNRLKEIIKYKTGGRKNEFATLCGWTPQYLQKLLRGENFGIQPVLTILGALPEINARWFLLGQGDMLEIGKLYNLQREAFAHIQSLLEIEKFVPFMSSEDLHEFEQAVTAGRSPVFSPDKLASWQEQASKRKNYLDAKFADANSKSDKLCRQKTANK